MNNTVYAESVNYWKTSQKHPETWLKDSVKLIKGIGGLVTACVQASDSQERAGFMLEFSLGSDKFRLTWNALPSKSGNDRAAAIQAATLLYHDVKHKVVMAKIKGTRMAFVEYLLLPDNQTVAESVERVKLIGSAPILLGEPKRV